ncbi:MAG TPA: HdeD family acid-resistance protein [Steroidobacteraceae bacterium]|nr:HdeD family acid-resistance protein [Steroidobacteraceae bacterium]
MSAPSDATRVASELAGAVRRHRVLFLAEGIALVILGLLAVMAPAVASVAATVFFGWILLVSGVAGLLTTLRGRQVPGFAWSLLSAVVGIVAGLLLLGWPLQGTLSLTAVLIAFLWVEGIVTIMYALEHRDALSGRWGWMLASGILDVGLGVLILAGLPGTALWALGLIVGINLLFGGWALILMALHARGAGLS